MLLLLLLLLLHQGQNSLKQVLLKAFFHRINRRIHIRHHCFRRWVIRAAAASPRAAGRRTRQLPRAFAAGSSGGTAHTISKVITITTVTPFTATGREPGCWWWCVTVVGQPPAAPCHGVTLHPSHSAMYGHRPRQRHDQKHHHTTTNTQ